MDLLVFFLKTLILFFMLWVLLWIQNSGKVRVIGRGRKALRFLKGRESTVFYWAHWKFGLNAMINSGAVFTHNRERYRPVREMCPGADGGDFALDWFEDSTKPALPDTAPIVVIAHGLSGGSSEPSVQKLGLRCVREFGWRSVCVIFRGCCGTTLKTPRIYNGGYTEDFHIALDLISKRYPRAPIALVGYSLGSNMIAKYLGERTSENRPIVTYQHIKDGASIPQNVICAACVCCPFDLVYSDKHYTKKQQIRVGQNLLRYKEKHAEALRSVADFDAFEAKKDFRVHAFDEAFTSKMFGYKSVDDFYEDASSRRFLDGIRIPVLFITAKNDPVSLYGGFPATLIRKNENLAALVAKGGGHMGFFSFLDTHKMFDEEMIKEYLTDMFSDSKASAQRSKEKSV